MFCGYPSNDIIEFIKSHKNLPYDSEVEYLESTGTQWIGTGISADQDILLECTGRWTDVSTTVVRYAVNAAASGRINFGWMLNRTGSGFGLAAVTNSPTVADADTEWHSVSVCSTEESPCYEFDGEKSSLTPQSSVSLLGIIKLFGNGTNNASIRISYVKISRPSTDLTLLDLIPVRFTNQLGEPEGAMYDRLGVGGMNPDGSPRNDGLYRNQGTGSFLLGDDV